MIAILDLVWKPNEVFVEELLLENQLVLWDHKLIHKFCAKVVVVRGTLSENSAVGNILRDSSDDHSGGQGFILLELLKLSNFILCDPH